MYRGELGADLQQRVPSSRHYGFVPTVRLVFYCVLPGREVWGKPRPGVGATTRNLRLKVFVLHMDVRRDVCIHTPDLCCCLERGECVCYRIKAAG